MLESKLSRYVGILFKLKSFLPKYILSIIYYAFIHSYLNYGLIIWGATPASSLSKLCRIQNKALRVFLNCYVTLEYFKFSRTWLGI